MIDVVEHIVSGKKLDFAMANVQRCLAENSRFMVTPVVEKGRQSLFYVRFWTVEDIKWRLSECLVGEPIPFRNSNLLIARKPAKPVTKIGVN